jgi:hypothetical protein
LPFQFFLDLQQIVANQAKHLADDLGVGKPHSAKQT